MAFRGSRHAYQGSLTFQVVLKDLRLRPGIQGFGLKLWDGGHSFEKVDG